MVYFSAVGETCDSLYTNQVVKPYSKPNARNVCTSNGPLYLRST